MSQNAVISGVFADLKTVKSRSTIQMVIELPIEHGERVVAMFGFPQPGAEIAVAVARLVAEPARPAPAAGTPKPGGQKWDECKYAKQVSVACANPEFWLWLGTRWEGTRVIMCTEDAVAEVKHQVGIASRKELDADPQGPAVQRWNELYGEFKRWRADRVGQEQAEAQAQAYRR